MRIESDIIGPVNIPADALYGVNAFRAQRNFTNNSQFSDLWYAAMGVVKYVCYKTYREFKQSAISEFGGKVPFEFFDEPIIDALCNAALEVSEGKWRDQFIVPAVQGGAGTSINMNVNEIITNRALQLMGEAPGEYHKINPNDHANVFQSTNDVVPTALRVVIMQLLNQLEAVINSSRIETERIETLYRDVPRMAYTQMQQAVPSTYGRLFSTYSDMLSRDWWRVSKCFERIKVVNLGGSAIGTSMAVPKYFVMEVVQNLQQYTGLPLTRGENLTDTTANLDAFVEIHATLKAHAVNLEKLAGDIRLLASDISKESLKIPTRQAGSSIMPGKINPVISEYIISVAHKVYANDVLISSLSGQSCLELNAYIPLIGDALLNSLQLLIAANTSLEEHLLNGIEIDTEQALREFLQSPGLSTVLIPYVGYKKATDCAVLMRNQKMDIYSANEQLQLIDTDKLKQLLIPSNLLKQGFSLRDL
jgi:aspartate ammonia-lyase